MGNASKYGGFTIETPGLHPATQCCLEALMWLEGKIRVRRGLDMGCGNGILSLAASLTFDADILAADIAAAAVQDTRAHAQAHGLSQRITAIRSDGFSERIIAVRAPYDLILFNLLAEPIVAMAPAVRGYLAEGGVCVLSGVLAWKAAEVDAVYAALGFHTLHRISRSPWETFILAKSRLDEK